MRKLLRFLKWPVHLLTFLAMPCMWFGGIAVHLYTILVAYKIAGFFAAILALAMPLIAQIYWFIKIWINIGSFLNGYSVVILAYIAVMVVTFGTFGLSSYLETLEESDS